MSTTERKQHVPAQAVHINVSQFSGHSVMPIAHPCASPTDTGAESDQTHTAGTLCGTLAGTRPAGLHGSECITTAGDTDARMPLSLIARIEDGMVKTTHAQAMVGTEVTRTSGGIIVEVGIDQGGSEARASTTAYGPMEGGLVKTSHVDHAGADAATVRRGEDDAIEVSPHMGARRLTGGRPSIPSGASILERSHGYHRSFIQAGCHYHVI